MNQWHGLPFANNIGLDKRCVLWLIRNSKKDILYLRGYSTFPGSLNSIDSISHLLTQTRKVDVVIKINWNPVYLFSDSKLTNRKRIIMNVTILK